MLSISSNIKLQNTDNFKLRQKAFRGADVSDLLSRGNKALNENKYKEALNYYNQAHSRNPDEVKVYRQMAKAQFGLKNYVLAEENFQKYLKENPDDSDIIIELGETQRQMGQYQKAINTFEKAYRLDNTNDLAARSLKTAKNDLLAVYSPEKAYKEKKEYAQKNLEAALNMTVNYLTPQYMNKLKNVTFKFGKTASMGGTGNIAQYENSKNSITISNSYIYASPQVIAAYLSHESVHAHDNDAFTSVTEEQDAYEVATKFWMKNSNGVKDPEMDYAVELYKKSPETLKNRVKEIYTLRDPSIALTSPNHPPQKLFHWGNTNNQAASQAIKSYDVIA